MTDPKDLARIIAMLLDLPERCERRGILHQLPA